ncbi:Dot/Icm T4SS effector [Legionella santicrucis]|uniref:Dot/Icm T4SS effector n=1 Tax=Legionella santicrucis TaxID=45074 RepID=A0A0W0YI68_9GAMM|nr:hypothetical protein [Legionella santicrucis]KTD56562.1 Dot/Icm T4SS effector [Legionella santicrucis]
MTKLYVYSLDYDGCMAEKTLKEMIEANAELIEEITDRINAGNEVTICVGSNRQGIHKDHYNSRKSGCVSVFTAYPALVEKIKTKIEDNANKNNIKFDGFLTIDAQQGEVPGTNFNKYQKISYITDKRIPTLDDIKDIKNLPENKTDESKISTLYAQMHHFAFLHPNEEIEFVFKDDQKIILELLHQFYSQNQNLIPRNITLKLEQKISNEVKNAIEIKINEDKFSELDAWNATIGGKADSLPAIKGTGHLDSDYSKTSTAMLIIANQIASKREEVHPSKTGFSTPRQIFNNPKKALEEVNRVASNAKYGYFSGNELNNTFLAAFKEYQLEKEIAKQMNVFVDVRQEAEQNTLTSDHEFQAFNGPIRHASYNVAITGPFCMQNSDPYDHHSDFNSRLTEVLGIKDAGKWHQQRIKREQAKIIAAANNGISLFNLQETSAVFVQETLDKLNRVNSGHYKALSFSFNNSPDRLQHNLAIIYNSQELTPIGAPFYREENTRIIGQAFKKIDPATGKVQYLVMQNIHGYHFDKAQDGENTLKKLLELPEPIKSNIEDIIKKENNHTLPDYDVCLTGDTNCCHPPTDDEFKYIGVNTATVPPQNATYFDDVYRVDYTDGAFFTTYKNGKRIDTAPQIVNPEIIGAQGTPIENIKVPAHLALKNNHFQEFPFASQYNLDKFQQRFNRLNIQGCGIIYEKNDYNVCRVKITSKEDISLQLEEVFNYVEKIKTSNGFKYNVYPNEEITQLKIEKREHLKYSMRSELINLVDEGDKEQLRVTIKEWLESYPDLLKETLEVNTADIEQDVFLKASTAKNFNIGTAWGNNPDTLFPTAPSISAILNYAAYKVGITNFGDLNKYTSQQKLDYIYKNINDKKLADKDKQLFANIYVDYPEETRNNHLNGAIHFLQSLKTSLTPPLRIEELALDKHSERRKRGEKKFANESKDYNQAKENIIRELNSFKESYQSHLTGVKNHTTRNAKINIAVGAIAVLTGGAAIAAILLTAPFSLPAIVGISLLGLAITTAVLATSTRARSFLKEASSMQKLINFLDNSVTHKKELLGHSEKEALKTNNAIKDKMEHIAKLENGTRLFEELVRIRDAEEKISTHMPKKEQVKVRMDALDKQSHDNVIAIQNLLISVGEGKGDYIEQELKNAKNRLDKLPKFVQSHLQNYLYESDPQKNKQLEAGINKLLGSKKQIETNPSQQEEQKPISNKRRGSVFSLGMFSQNNATVLSSSQVPSQNIQKIKEERNVMQNNDEENLKTPLIYPVLS